MAVAAMLFAACGSGASPAPGDTAADGTDAAERADSLETAMIHRADSILGATPVLSNAEEAALRQFVQADHIERARRLGIDPIDDRRTAGALMAAEEGRVVRLRTNDFYIVDPRMGYAVPLLVPAAAAALVELARRFQEDLAGAGLPPFQFILTNVLRTGIDQAYLRGRNVNAARGESTHEYATTFDVYYERFHYVAHRDTSLSRMGVGVDRLDVERLHKRLRPAYRNLGTARAERLKAVLGRSLIALQDDGMLMVTYERAQPVFHVTVAREMPAPTPIESGEPRHAYADTESRLADIDNDLENLRVDGNGPLPGPLVVGRDSIEQRLDRFGPTDEPPSLESARELERSVAELEGHVARAELETSGSSARLRSQLRPADLALTLLEARLDHGPEARREHFETALSDLRTQYDGLADMADRIGNTPGALSSAARNLGRFVTDVILLASAVDEVE